MRIDINFRNMLQAGTGTMMERFDGHALSMMEAAIAEDCQVSHGVLEKVMTWLRLAGITATGYAHLCTANGHGVSFLDHADYDLGLRWTIDIFYYPTTLPSASTTQPIYWRADTSNNKVTVLEIDENGAFVFTHRDSNGTEVTLTTPHTVAAEQTVHVRVQRWFTELRIYVDGQQSATRSDLSGTYKTAPTSTKWYVGIDTVTDGDTPTNSCRGAVDDFRVWRDELRDGNKWSIASYPWMSDETLVLYARFDETTGAVTDWSHNDNDGTSLGGSRGNSALAKAIAPILKLFPMRTSSGEYEQWLVWAGDGAFYAVDVT